MSASRESAITWPRPQVSVLYAYGRLLNLQWCIQAKAAVEEAKYKARVQQRKDYMERESGRSDGPFFALLASFFILPAAVILIVAWQTGYLASLDTNQHF